MSLIPQTPCYLTKVGRDNKRTRASMAASGEITKLMDSVCANAANAHTSVLVNKFTLFIRKKRIRCTE